MYASQVVGKGNNKTAWSIVSSEEMTRPSLLDRNNNTTETAVFDCL